MGTEIIYILFGGFLLLLFIGAPITVALGVSTLITFLVLDENPIKFVQIAFTSVGSFPLMALPAFILAGALMEASGLSRRLISVAESFAGPFTGGMSAAAVFACLFFGAISGSGPATTAAVGMLMIPAMIQRNYSRDYASAITASSGGLGIVIPPSIPLIIFGIAALGMPPPPEAVAEHGTFQTVSIPKLFIAGFLPAFLIAGSLLIMNYILSKKRGYKGTTEGWSAREIWCEMYRGFWALMAPVVILGGIYSGFFTPTEAAIVAIFYTLVVGAFIYRE
ncbi:MAG: TRAP transporter large permease, partial [Pseudomonadota bacterium]